MSALYLSDIERGCGAAGFPPRRLGAYPVFASLRPASLGAFTAKKALDYHCCPTVPCPLTSTEKRLRALRPAVSLCRCGPRPSSLRFATPGKPGYLHSEKCPEKRPFFAVQRRSLIASAQANCRPPLAKCKTQRSLASLAHPVQSNQDSRLTPRGNTRNTGTWPDQVFS
jgi:hypothetical protein